MFLGVPEGHQGLGFLSHLRHLWFLVDPLSPWALEVPWGLACLGFLVCHRSLGLLSSPWVLEVRVIPQPLLVPRDPGSLGYLGFLVRNNNDHKLHMLTSPVEVKCSILSFHFQFRIVFGRLSDCIFDLQSFLSSLLLLWSSGQFNEKKVRTARVLDEKGSCTC